jgi:hypothetical protein
MLLARRLLEAPAQSRLTIHNFDFYCFLARVARTDKKSGSSSSHVYATNCSRQGCKYYSARAELPIFVSLLIDTWRCVFIACQKGLEINTRKLGASAL